MEIIISIQVNINVIKMKIMFENVTEIKASIGLVVVYGV